MLHHDGIMRLLCSIVTAWTLLHCPCNGQDLISGATAEMSAIAQKGVRFRMDKFKVEAAEAACLNKAKDTAVGELTKLINALDDERLKPPLKKVKEVIMNAGVNITRAVAHSAIAVSGKVRTSLVILRQRGHFGQKARVISEVLSVLPGRGLPREESQGEMRGILGTIVATVFRVLGQDDIIDMITDQSRELDEDMGFDKNLLKGVVDLCERAIEDDHSDQVLNKNTQIVLIYYMQSRYQTFMEALRTVISTHNYETGKVPAKVLNTIRFFTLMSNVHIHLLGLAYCSGKTKNSPMKLNEMIDQMRTNDERARECLRFLETPTHKQAFTSSMLFYDKYPEIVWYLNSIGLDPYKDHKELTSGGCFLLNNAWYPDEYYFGLKSDPGQGKKVHYAYAYDFSPDDKNVRFKFSYQGSGFLTMQAAGGAPGADWNYAVKDTPNFKPELSYAPYQPEDEEGMPDHDKLFRLVKIRDRDEACNNRWFLANAGTNKLLKYNNGYNIVPADNVVLDKYHCWILTRVMC